MPVESSSIARKIEQSCAILPNTFNLAKAALLQLRLHRSGGVLDAPVRSKHVSAHMPADPQEMFEALLQATEILKLEFSDLEGSGREILVKCENALRRTRSVCTIELPLH